MISGPFHPDLKVGSKWKLQDDIYKISQNYDNYVIVITNGRGVYKCVFASWFYTVATPYIEFKWEKFVFTVETEKSYVILNNKDFEFLYNYERYREEVDTGEFKIKEQHYVRNDNGITLQFSTDKYAKAFLELAKENDCL